jgi:cell shape-determining protein MreC
MKKYSSITRVNSRLTSPKRLRLGIVITIIILVFGYFFPKIISTVSFVVMYPVHMVGTWYQTSESSFPNYLRTRSELVTEIESLKRQIVNDNGTQMSVRRLLEENIQLRAVTGFGTTTPRVVARVLAQPNRLTYDLLQIDKGSNDNIVVGAPVFLGLDTVIGVVVHLTPNYSFVELLTSPGFESTAYVVGPNIFATLEGVGGGVARVKVPQGVTLSTGNLVILPSVESGVYGEIVSIENPPTQPVQYGYVTPPVSLQSILYVSVSEDSVTDRPFPEIENQIRALKNNYFRLSEVPIWSATGTATTAGTEGVGRASTLNDVEVVETAN